MTSRETQLEAAVRAQDALIVQAQMEVERYLSKQFEAAELVDRLIRILDGSQQREAQRLARQALAKISATTHSDGRSSENGAQLPSLPGRPLGL
jgi:hypothetical protein